MPRKPKAKDEPAIKRRRGRRTKLAQEPALALDPQGADDVNAEAEAQKTLETQMSNDSRFIEGMSTSQQQHLMRARRDAVIAAVAEMTLKERMNTLGRIDLICAQIETMNLTVRDALLRIPTRLANTLVGLKSAEIERRLHDEIEDALRNLQTPLLETAEKSTKTTRVYKSAGGVPEAVKNIPRLKQGVGVYRA
jgi:hypothetical protein